MKVFIAFIGALIGGLILFFLGIAVTMTLNMVIYMYVNIWLAYVLSVLVTFGGVYKATEMGFLKFPYGIMRVKTMFLFGFFALFIISTAVFNLYNHDYFDQFNGMPKWVYLLLQVVAVLGTLSVWNEVHKLVIENRIREDVRKGVQEELEAKYPNVKHY